MKRLNLLSGILMAIAMTLSFSACSDNNDPAPTPDPDPQPELSDYHFDIFMTIGKHGGMNQGDGTIVKSVNSLTADMEVIDINLPSPARTVSSQVLSVPVRQRRGCPLRCLRTSAGAYR